MNAYVLFIMLFMCSVLSQGQNLVPNPSFELRGKYNVPLHWRLIAPSVDVISGGKRIFPKYQSDEYDHIYGKYLPDTGSDGSSYICLFKLTDGSEAIAVKLTDSLQEGAMYRIHMDVYKPYVPSKYPLFEMGVFLMEDMPSSCNEQECFQDNGSLVTLVNEDKPILYEGEWIRVTGEFMSNGRESVLVLCHPEKINRPINKPDHLVAYLFDNIQVIKKSNRKKLASYYFESGSFELNESQITEISKLRLDGYRLLSVEGSSSVDGDSEYNKELSLHRAKSISNFLENRFEGDIVIVGNGELSTNDADKARRVDVFGVEDMSQVMNKPSQEKLYTFIRDMERLYKRDQYFLKNANRHSSKELDEHSSRLNLKIDSILNTNLFNSFKWDRRTEDKLITCYLHSHDSLQLKYFEQMNSSYEQGLISKENWPYILDRYRFIRNEPQRFGTQLHDPDGILQLYKVKNLDEIDSLRLSFGLDSLSHYLNSVKARYK